MARGRAREGGQPCGARGAPRGSLVARRPERARVERPAHRHGRCAHGPCTHRERRAPRHVKVPSCVRRHRLERSKCTRPGGPCTALPGHSGTCAWRLAHVQSPTAGTSGAGKRASAAHGTQALPHRPAHTESLVNQTRAKTHSQRHPERTHNADMYTPRLLAFAPLCCFCRAQSSQHLFAKLKTARTLRCVHTFYRGTLTQKAIRPPFSPLGHRHNQPCAQTRPLPQPRGTYMTSGLGGSSDSHVEAQPQCLAWPVTGLPSTSKTEAKSLHPAA